MLVHNHKKNYHIFILTSMNATESYFCSVNKVIVVGNSKDLMLRKDGHRIDSFDHIVRINSFATVGFEEYVGSRIDIVSVSLFPETVKNALVHSKLLIAQANEVWSPSWKGKFSSAEVDLFLNTIEVERQKLRFADDFKCVDILKQLFIDVNERSNARIKELGQEEKTFYPTTGLLTLFMVEQVFNNCQIFITGFGQNAIDKNTAERFDTSGALMWNGHDIPAERVILQEKIEAGIYFLLK